jgi:hypothetical protein
MTVTQIIFATIWALRPWCDHHAFFYHPSTSSNLRHDPVDAQTSSLDTVFSVEFAEQDFTSYTVDGEAAGLYKNAGTFSYLRIFGAGHEVPAYLWVDVPRGAAALQMFTQIMSGSQLSST